MWCCRGCPLTASVRSRWLVHGEDGIEFGGADGAVTGTYWVRWGEGARRVDEPSDELLDALRVDQSNVMVSVVGDWVHLGEGAQARAYALRDLPRDDGERWIAQARHDGEFLVLTVHPAHLPCSSGVSWASLAETGELLSCGANTAAMAFVAPEVPESRLVLPNPSVMDTYLECALRFSLSDLPFTAQRELVTR